MKQRLLIVDDEPGIVDMMASYFSSQYEVLTAYCGNEALQKLARQPDLILLDINMPDIDGLTLCQKIRELITCPILFLTARVESADKIIGFQAGADDYIIKPFDLDELGARVAAHLRREQRHRNKATIRFFGELTIDYSARTVTVAGEPVALSKREFDIVELLSLNAGQVFDRERFMKQCGDLTARVTVILSWNISGKSGRSWLLVRFTVILIQFGGVVIGGTSEKYGIKENFSRPICFLCFGGSPDVRLSLYDMQFNQQQLSLRWNRNFSRRFNR